MPTKEYKHLFFDLDHTLWDFEKNSYEALVEIFSKHNLTELGVSNFDNFFGRYKVINEFYWDEYRKGLIEKEKLRYIRFHEALQEFGVRDLLLAKRVADDYVGISPKKKNLRPFAIDVLTYLKAKYVLHIITNGFQEVQYIKLKNSGLIDFFDVIVTSESAGYKKPAPQIFTHSMRQAGAKRKESLMIGDNLVADLIGARGVGMDQVFYNIDKVRHSEKLTYEISCLSELKNML